MIAEILIGGALLYMLWKIFAEPKGLPPGPWGYPIIGKIPDRKKTMLTTLDELFESHGQVFKYKFGSLPFIFLGDVKLIKEIYSKFEVTNRATANTLEIFSRFQNAGIISSSGPKWQKSRRFAIRHLRDFGFGRSSMEEVIHAESEALIKDLKTRCGEPTEVPWSVNVAALNIIWKLVADRRYDVDDKEIQQFSKLINRNFEILQGMAGLLDVFPFLVKILPKFVQMKWFGGDELEQSFTDLFDFYTPIVNEHKDTLDANDARDYIDTYLIEMDKQKDDPESEFNDIDLLTCLADLFGAGTETTSSTLRWMIFLMAKHPEIQKKVQKEIDDVVGRDALPGLNDRSNLPYVNAVLMEVMRYSSLLPIGVSHETSDEIEIAGYTIPKGYVVAAYLMGIHRDPKIWEKPTEFHPEHFLDEDGQFRPREECIPFSLGRRSCLGENLARMEYFGFATAILSKFFFSPPEGEVMTEITDRNQPILHLIKPFKVVISERE